MSSGMDMRQETIVVLTPRELDVLRLLAGGCTYWQIAMHLGVSPHTVVTHIKNAYRKLDVHNAASAVMRAVQLGIFPREASNKHAVSHDRGMVGVLKPAYDESGG